MKAFSLCVQGLHRRIGGLWPSAMSACKRDYARVQHRRATAVRAARISQILGGKSANLSQIDVSSRTRWRGLPQHLAGTVRPLALVRVIVSATSQPCHPAAKTNATKLIGPRVLLARGAKPFDCDHRPQLDEPSPNAFHYASLRKDPPLTRCPIRCVKTHLASHSWLVFGQNLPKQVNLLRAQLQELEDVLHAGVHGELGAPLRRLQLAGVPLYSRRWLQRQVPKNASTSGEAVGHPRWSSPTPPDLWLWRCGHALHAVGTRTGSLSAARPVKTLRLSRL